MRRSRSGIPEGSEELILFVLNLQPVGQELFFNWAVAGIDPSLEGIEEGKPPSGVTLGQNGFGKEGYSVCPQAEAETIVFALYALPSALTRQGLRSDDAAQSGAGGFGERGALGGVLWAGLGTLGSLKAREI